MVLALLLIAAASAQIPDTDSRLDISKGTRHEFPMPHYANRAEWEARKSHLRKQVLAAAGLLPMPVRGPIKGEVFGKLDRDGYSIEKVFLETLPGYYLGGNLYRPRGKSGKFPGILSPHGHWKLGRLEDSALGSIPARCINLARQGYVVFAYDMVGYNDTNQTPHVFGGQRENLWNFQPFALQTWNSLRALDWLETLPDVDKTRLGVTGASGGGTQTFFLAAIDDRVHVDVPVNMVSGIMQGGSPCENAPGLRHDAINVDYAAMMAPRPMLLVSATGDWTKNVPRNEFPAIRDIYNLYDAGPQVEVVQYDSPHNYHKESRQSMYTFFAKRFQGKDGTLILEQPYTMEKLDDMLVWSGRSKPAGAIDYDGVFAAWRDRTKLARPDREAMRFALSVENPTKVIAETKDGDVVLSRAGRGDRVTGKWQPGKGKARIVVSSDGAVGPSSTAQPTLYLNVWNAKRDSSSSHFYTFHRTDDQNRVQDILTAISWITKTNGAPELHCSGQASIWCRFAAAVSDTPVVLKTDSQTLEASDEEVIRTFYVPGIQRVGGWKAAVALSRR